MFLLLSADSFLQNNLLSKHYFRNTSLLECQTVWIQIRTDVLGPNSLQRSSTDDKGSETLAQELAHMDHSLIYKMGFVSTFRWFFTN